MSTVGSKHPKSHFSRCCLTWTPSPPTLMDASPGHSPVLHSVDGATFRNEASHGQRLLQGVPHSHSAASRHLNKTVLGEFYLFIYSLFKINYDSFLNSILFYNKRRWSGDTSGRSSFYSCKSGPLSLASLAWFRRLHGTGRGVPKTQKHISTNY